MKVLIASALVFLALLERVFFDLGPNVELVTLVMLLAAMYLGKKYSSFVVLATLIISDLIIGNSNIAIFTWTGFLIPGLAIPFFFKKGTGAYNILFGTGAGIGANLFFFLWTNFGVWLLSSMYPNTSLGLVAAYVNGLPFLKMQLLSTLLFVPAGIVITELIHNLHRSYKTSINHLMTVFKEAR